jgi:hypothetical protein
MAVAWLVLAQGVAAQSSASTPEDGTYRRDIERWRAEREASLRLKDGWLSISGLFFLKEGLNRFGSDRSNEIVLPSSSPARAGTFELRQGRVFATITRGVDASFRDRPVRPDTPFEMKKAGDLGQGDALAIGPLTLFVHLSGDKLAIRMRDAESALLKQFTGLKWFAVDPSYRVTARFIPFDTPRNVNVPNILGDMERYVTPGVLAFTLEGREYRLQPFQVGSPGSHRFFIVFRDLTSGKETYSAARFVYADMPKNGTTIIDFNRAYNPPCAFNPFTTCPLPLPSNRLAVRITAGERNYGHDNAVPTRPG